MLTQVLDRIIIQGNIQGYINHKLLYYTYFLKYEKLGTINTELLAKVYNVIIKTKYIHQILLTSRNNYESFNPYT
jgi:hypothetical protein